MDFIKLQALGNDFMLIDLRKIKLRISNAKTIQKLANPKQGVGFDQLLLLKPSIKKTVNAELIFYNADGSVAEMCGNGLRAAALYLWKHMRTREALRIKTAAGIRQARLLGPLKQGSIECEMGVPKFPKLPKSLNRGVLLDKKRFIPVCVNVGNPHAVLLLEKKQKLSNSILKLGPLLETHKAFPKRTNVELVKIKNRHAIWVHVWERGVGITDACGTGAIASACVAILKGKVTSPVKVIFPGGTVEVRWRGPGFPAFLRGHATEVYTGKLQY